MMITAVATTTVMDGHTALVIVSQNATVMVGIMVATIKGTTFVVTVIWTVFLANVWIASLICAATLTTVTTVIMSMVAGSLGGGHGSS
jgi:hypothetical protein